MKIFYLFIFLMLGALTGNTQSFLGKTTNFIRIEISKDTTIKEFKVTKSLQYEEGNVIEAKQIKDDCTIKMSFAMMNDTCIYMVYDYSNNSSLGMYLAVFSYCVKVEDPQNNLWMSKDGVFYRLNKNKGGKGFNVEIWK